MTFFGQEYLQSTRQDGGGALSGWLEAQKVKEKETEDQLRKMKDKLHADLETLKRVGGAKFFVVDVLVVFFLGHHCEQC